MKRLPEGGTSIDRSSSLEFTFDGTKVTAHQGDTIGSALAAAGVRVVSRSFKYHRPRGLLCCSGHCPNCLVQIGDEPNVRACMRPVEQGIRVRSQNAWPSLRFDLLSLSRFASRFMPAGFYYKTFMRPRWLWPLYERVLRNAAGLGVVDPKTPRGRYDKRYLHADIVVAGGGPAGISAAHAAGKSGARVLLVDENAALGSHLRFSDADSGSAATRVEQMRDELEGMANVELLTGTSVLGWYRNDWLAAKTGNRLFKIRMGSLVAATGAFERPLQFENNDLPGIMLGSAVRRLLHQYGVAAGQRVLVVTANDDGWEIAAELRAAGVEVVGIADERPVDACTSPHVDALTSQGTPIHYQHTVVKAVGANAVGSVIIAQVAVGDAVDKTTCKTIGCDLLAVSVGWTPDTELTHLAGGKTRYDSDRAEMLPSELPPHLHVVGRAAGTHDLAAQILEGTIAGQAAAHRHGIGAEPDAEVAAELQRLKSAAPGRSSARVSIPGGVAKKRFVCLCEDVTEEDILTTIAEGFDSMQLLKRYSTVSMGPCQGKMCSMAAIQICARETDRSIPDTGTTTSRPPATPVSLGTLAGQEMEPVQLGTLHDWHMANGGKPMVAGRWIRAEHYGDPLAEVKAVREAAGLIDVSSLGKLRLTGPGVPDLLQRVYINKWRKLGIGRSRYGVMCNDEGIVLDDGVCARIGEEEWYMSTTSSGATGMYDWMQWWMQSGWGEGVHLTNVTEAFAAMNLAGPRTRDVLGDLTDIDLSNEAFPYMAVRSGAVAGVPCRLLRIGFTGEHSYEIHCPSGYAGHLWDALIAAGQPHGIKPFGVEAQRVLRLEKGHIIVGHDTDGLTDPIMANMEWAVKLDKTDFLGIRHMSRIAEHGPRDRLVGFKIPAGGTKPEEGMQIVAAANGQREVIGWVTSCRLSPTLGEIIGLCWLPAELGDREGAEFTIHIDGRSQPASVWHGAFYDPEGTRLRT